MPFHLFGSGSSGLGAYGIKVIRPNYTLHELALRDRQYVQYAASLSIATPDSQGNTVLTDVDVKGKVLASVLCIHPILIFSILMAWPAFSIREKVKKIFFSLPFLAVITVIDFPFHILYSMEMGLPAQAGYDKFLLYWGRILNNGGRQFLSLLVVFLLIASHYVAKPAMTGERVGRNAPCPCGSGKKYKRCCLPK